MKFAPLVANVRINQLLCASALVLMAGAASAQTAKEMLVEPAYDSVAPSAVAVEPVVATAPVLSSATTVTGHLYVSPTGSDSNPGTQSRPVKTIARADALARAGYVIHVAPGTYSVAAPSLSSAGIRTTKSGTATARIRFQSDVKWGAKIVFSGTGLGWNSKGAYVDIVGFDITGAGRIGILAEGGHEIISNNLVHDLKVSGG